MFNIIKLYKILLDFLYPYFCLSCYKFIDNGYICKDCLEKIDFSLKIICPKCQRRRPISENFLTICCDSTIKSLIYFADYEIPVIQKLIKFGKFDSYHKIWNFFANILLEDLKKLDFKDFYLTYVPMTKEEIKQRGFNQTEILTKEISKKLNIKIFEGIKKIKQTKQQSLLKYEERFKNIEGAFDCLTEAPKNIIIIDDVFTTGATLKEIAKTLKIKGAKNIIGLVIAK